MSIYDVKIESWDGSDKDFLNKYKGKVTLFINVTGDCGNAPQYGIIESIYRKYKDKGFEVVAIPTNEYCGSGITYGEFECGIKDAAHAKNYANEVYDVTYDFTELVVSNPGKPIDPEMAKELYGGRISEFPRQLEDGEEPHEIFKELSKQSQKTTKVGVHQFGNFEKYLIDKNGILRKKYHNGTLLDFAYPDHVDAPDVEYERLCNDIEELLSV